MLPLPKAKMQSIYIIIISTIRVDAQERDGQLLEAKDSQVCCELIKYFQQIPAYLMSEQGHLLFIKIANV
jgi:hypothetical protein